MPGEHTSSLATREDLIDALQEAAELEHGLMLQYLFAALSLKKRLDEGLTGKQQESVRHWQADILSVAREEMSHLGTVCNLLSAVGGAPHFTRPNFPQPAKDYYPFSFQLTRLSDETLYRFIRAEMPKGERPPDPPASTAMDFAAVVPEPIEYEYVGELYGQIRSAFGAIPAEVLFIGPPRAQDVEQWSRRMQVLGVVDQKSADAAIDFIVLEGEGSPGRRRGSHYETFLSIRRALGDLFQGGRLLPTRPVVTNPRTREHRDAHAAGFILTNPSAVKAAEVFNAAYEIGLLMLMQFYSYGGETSGQRSALMNSSRELMTMVLRPIGEILTEIPASADTSEGTAGPTFELYATVALSTQIQNRWTVLAERLESAQSAARQLKDVHPRFTIIGDDLALLRQNLFAALDTGVQ